MATKTRKKRPEVTAKPDTRETVSPLDESLPRQPASLEGQKPLPMKLPAKKADEPVVVRSGLVEFLKQLDLEAFLDDWPEGEIRRRVDAHYGTEKNRRVSSKELAKASHSAFDLYGRRLLPESLNSLLTSDQWDYVKGKVSRQLPMMHNRTLRQCVRICRLVVACNERILQGLPSRFHVWKGAASNG